MKKPQLCIGSVQFGKNYGVTNNNGKINPLDVSKILRKMIDNNIEYIDTAQSYGDAEKVLGSMILNKNKYKIITKINPLLCEGIEKNLQKNFLNKTFNKSLFNLKQHSIEGLLLHSPKNLNKSEKSFLTDWLCQIKDEKKVKKIGLSIYDEEDIVDFDINLLDIIQLPFSIYDTRLQNSGFLKHLNSNGVEVYARSIFLQGLILTSGSKWPKWIQKEDIEMHKQFINRINELNISLLDAALSFVYNSANIKKIIVGVSSLHEFNQIIDSFKKIDLINLKKLSGNIPIFKKSILDPRLWHLK
tara:strand:+ start:59 stop:961 length:903 start_codon:yes stop_codon:yes gene_type:complete